MNLKTHCAFVDVVQDAVGSVFARIHQAIVVAVLVAVEQTVFVAVFARIEHAIAVAVFTGHEDAVAQNVVAGTVRPTNAGKALQVGAAQGHGLDVEVDVIEVRAGHIANVSEQRA